MIRKLLMICLMASAFATSVNVYAAYDTNFVWRRSADWVPGTVPGNSIGNASPDKMGNPVWRYEYVTGGNLSSSNPWYSQPGNLMVWDDKWFPMETFGSWARGYTGPGEENINPPINRWGMAQDISKTYFSWDYAPIVKWVNPVGGIAILNLEGNPDVIWEGAGGGPDLDIEVAIGLHHMDGTTDLLYSNRFSNPNPAIDHKPFPSVVFPISMTGIRVGFGEELSFSARVDGGPLDTENTKWILFGDPFKLTLVSVVPEPQFYIMLLAGLVVLTIGIRREKRKVIADNLN